MNPVINQTYNVNNQTNELPELGIPLPIDALGVSYSSLNSKQVAVLSLIY
jgi:hypothetical protein